MPWFKIRCPRLVHRHTHSKDLSVSCTTTSIYLVFVHYFIWFINMHCCYTCTYSAKSRDENIHRCLGQHNKRLFFAYVYVHTFHFYKITWLDLGKYYLATTLWNCPTLITLQNDSCYSISRAWEIKLSHKKALIWPLKSIARLSTFSDCLVKGTQSLKEYKHNIKLWSAY